jgi:hypothetical protein
MKCRGSLNPTFAPDIQEGILSDTQMLEMVILKNKFMTYP